MARGFLRKSSLSLPVSLFQVHWTSLARERLAVMPFDALAQLEGQLGLAVVPGPALRQVGHDGLGRVERLVLVVDDEVVEDAHEGLHRGDGGFLVDRAAGQVVAMVDAQRAALLLRQGGTSCQADGKHCHRKRECDLQGHQPSSQSCRPGGHRQAYCSAGYANRRLACEQALPWDGEAASACRRLSRPAHRPRRCPAPVRAR